MPLDLVDSEEEERHPERGDRVHDQLVDERRDRSEPGADVGEQLGDRDPRAEEDRIAVSPGRPPDGAQQPEAEAGARPDDQR